MRLRGGGHAADGHAAELPAPPRPSIAPAFALGIALWAACAASLGSAAQADGIECARHSVLMAALGACALVCALAASWHKVGKGSRRSRIPPALPLLLFALAGLSLGASLGFGFAAQLHATSVALTDVKNAQVVLELQEDTRDDGYSEKGLARIVEGPLAGAVVTASFERGREWRFGAVVSCTCTFAAFSENASEYAWRQGSACKAKASKVAELPLGIPAGVLVAARSRAIDAIGGADERNALLQALVCGYRRGVRDTKLYADFQTCGLAHLVAVSGAHLVIVTGLFASLFRVLRFPRGFTIAVLCAVMGAYLIVAGAPVSALRAVAMSTLGLLSFFGRRRTSSQSVLGVCIVGMIAAEPASALSASFALSALSTAGIIVMGPLFSHVLGRIPVIRASFVRESVSLTLSSSVLSQLYAGSLFGMLPLASPVANVVCTPFFPVACASGLVSGCLGAGGLPSAMADAVSSGVSQLLVFLVGLMAKLPYACVPFSMEPIAALAASGALAILIWVLWPAAPARMGTLAGMLAVGALAISIQPGAWADRIVMLDVGQGDSFLVQSRGSTLLVDTGNQDAMLLEGLGRLGVSHIDSVLVTHADDDHYGALDVIARAVDVDRVLVSSGMLECTCDDCRQVRALAADAASDMLGLSVGDRFRVGAFDMQVVWPRAFADEGGNADSLCLLASYDGDDDGRADFTAFFTGDAEIEQIDQILESGAVGDIDLLKVGHHGSRNAMTRTQVEALSPEVALIGVGRNNRYGHPTREILDLLEDAGCTVFRSDEDGEVACTLQAGSLSVRAMG